MTQEQILAMMKMGVKFPQKFLEANRIYLRNGGKSAVAIKAEYRVIDKHGRDVTKERMN